MPHFHLIIDFLAPSHHLQDQGTIKKMHKNVVSNVLSPSQREKFTRKQQRIVSQLYGTAEKNHELLVSVLNT